VDERGAGRTKAHIMFMTIDADAAPMPSQKAQLLRVQDRASRRSAPHPNKSIRGWRRVQGGAYDDTPDRFSRQPDPP
jgi:hypothetical protein